MPQDSAGEANADYRRPAWVEVDLAAIRHNVTEMSKFLGPDTRVMAVVKANAYGHGAAAVSRAALEAGAARLGVALVEEAQELLEAGITAPIHILAEPPASAARSIVAGRLIPTVTTIAFAEALSQTSKDLGIQVIVHVKVDTGMNRAGLDPGDTVDFVTRVSKLPGIVVEGLFTHFASADDPGSEVTQQQLDVFLDVVSELERAGITVPVKHVANSAATVLLPESRLDMVRLGISIYGLHPGGATRGEVDLRPALSLKCLVARVRRAAQGSGVSYRHTYHTERDGTTVATLPVGYGDGYPRGLSNRTFVLIGGWPFPQVGNICMDQLMVDTGKVEVNVGDGAVLIGRQGGQEITADELAKTLGTINYEVVTGLSRRLPRRYVGS